MLYMFCLQNGPFGVHGLSAQHHVVVVNDLAQELVFPVVIPPGDVLVTVHSRKPAIQSSVQVILTFSYVTADVFILFNSKIM